MFQWTPPIRPGGTARARPLALAVGARGTPRRTALDQGCGARLLVVGFDAVDADLLARHAPALVMSGAIGRGFDALDLAWRLSSLGYGGRFVAVARALPRPQMLRGEVRRACPGLRFEVVCLGGGRGLARAAAAG